MNGVPTGTAVIGGVRFTAPGDLFEPADGPWDLDLEVTWVESSPDVPGMPLAAPNRQHLWLDRDAELVRLPELPGGAAARSWQLRQVTPVVAACFDRLTLHASAVALGETAVAFVAESDAGKSTLAWELTKAGAAPLADDYLPVRFTDGPVVLEGPPLGHVCFLGRHDDTMTLTAIDASAAMQQHLANGFGEHGDPAANAFQFDAYHRLAAGIPHHDLTIPDDRGRLPEVVDWLPASLGVA